MQNIRIIIKQILNKILSSVIDILPIIIIITFFQLVIIRKPIPNLQNLIVGFVFVILGIFLFVQGLQIGLFPLGENISYLLIKKGNVFWLLLFSFLLGFSTTIAEPALIAICNESAEIAVENNFITNEFKFRFSMGIRIAVALSVGLAILIGVLRILKGWPIYYIIIAGYIIVIIITPFAPKEIVGIAYDTGGVTTSTITVPLVTSLGVGLANVIQGRNPLTDGFGLIALASLMPMIFVMLYGIIFFF